MTGHDRTSRVAGWRYGVSGGESVTFTSIKRLPNTGKSDDNLSEEPAGRVTIGLSGAGDADCVFEPKVLAFSCATALDYHGFR
jgi:hypothetical protein